jgi:hypothetical protein
VVSLRFHFTGFAWQGQRSTQDIGEKGLTLNSLSQARFDRLAHAAHPASPQTPSPAACHPTLPTCPVFLACGEESSFSAEPRLARLNTPANDISALAAKFRYFPYSLCLLGFAPLPEVRVGARTLVRDMQYPLCFDVLIRQERSCCEGCD